MRKLPIYRFFAPGSGSFFYYSDELPGNAINPTIIGFSGELAYFEQVFSASFFPTEIDNLTFWLETSTFIPSINWQPTSSNGPVFSWTPNASALTATSSFGADFVDIPDSTYATAGDLDNYISASSWHVFMVGVRDQNATLTSISDWHNHRMFGDANGWWGLYQKRQGSVANLNDSLIYAYSYAGSTQYRAHEPAPTIGEPYIFEYFKSTSDNTSSFKLNNRRTMRFLTNDIGITLNSITTQFGIQVLGGVGEVIIFDNALTAESRSAVRNYLTNKYNKSWNVDWDNSYPPADVDSMTFAGRADQYIESISLRSGSFTLESVQEVVNLVTGSSFRFTKAANGFEPTSIIKDGEKAFYFGISPSLDQFTGNSSFLSLISPNEWHVFTAVRFEQMSDTLQVQQYQVLGTETFNGAQQDLGFGLFFKTVSGQPYAIGHFYNGTTQFSVSASMYLGEKCLVEYYGSGSTMGIRVNNSASVETSFSGLLSGSGVSGSQIRPRIGSVNFAGGWLNTEVYDVMYELNVSNRRITGGNLTAIRNYYSDYYGITV